MRIQTFKKVLHGLKDIADFAVLITALIKTGEWLAGISGVPWSLAIVFVFAFALILGFFVWALQDSV